jgi:hypothetical protein
MKLNRKHGLKIKTTNPRSSTSHPLPSRPEVFPDYDQYDPAPFTIESPKAV